MFAEFRRESLTSQETAGLSVAGSKDMGNQMVAQRVDMPGRYVYILTDDVLVSPGRAPFLAFHESDYRFHRQVIGVTGSSISSLFRGTHTRSVFASGA